MQQRRLFHVINNDDETRLGPLRMQWWLSSMPRILFGIIAFCLLVTAFILSLISLIRQGQITTPPTPLPENVVFLVEQERVLAVIYEFARTLTQQDWVGNVGLFVPGSYIDFHRAMTFLSGPSLLPADTTTLAGWGQQLAVFAGGLSSQFMLITDCNVTFASVDTAFAQCIAIYSYTLAYSISFTTSNYPTQLVFFQPAFNLSLIGSDWQFTYASALVNATNTLLSSVETGVAPPGAITVRKRREKRITSAQTWTLLNQQIASLISSDQQATAVAICKTQQYVTLSATYDPYHNSTSLCDNLMLSTLELPNSLTCSNDVNIDTNCFNTSALTDMIPHVATVNAITPLPGTLDYTITAGIGIQITGGMHGITVNNIGLAALLLYGTDEYSLVKTELPIPSITMTKLPQLPHYVWAGPSSGNTSAAPTFRHLVYADLPPAMITGGSGISITSVAESYEISVDVSALNITTLNLAFAFPSAEFSVSGSPITTQIASLSVAKRNQAEGTVWAAPAIGMGNGVPTFRYLELEDLIPLAMGDNQIIIGRSAGLGTPVLGSIIGAGSITIDYIGNDIIIVDNDDDFIAGPGISIVDNNVTVTFSNTGAISVDLSMPGSVFSVSGGPITNGGSGTLSVSLLSHAASLFWASPMLISGVPSFRAIQLGDIPLIPLSSHVEGVLPLANGGTNNAGPYAGMAVIFSNAGGSQLVEGSVVVTNGLSMVAGPGPLLTISGVGGTCLTNQTISHTCLDLSSIQCSVPVDDTCIPSNLVLSTLTVTGGTILGTNTQCINHIDSSCIDISGQTCALGHISANCIDPDNLVLNSLRVGNLIASTLSVFSSNVTIVGTLSQEAINTTYLDVQNILLTGPMLCSNPGNYISPSCFDISGVQCTAHIDTSCIPENSTFLMVEVTDTLTVNNMLCPSHRLADECLGQRVVTINNIAPTASPNYDFIIAVGTGLSLTPGASSITLANTGVTNVDVSFPAVLFSQSGGPITTTGTITATLATQSANLFFAAPYAMAGTPSWRYIDFNDLPPIADSQIYYSVGGNLTAVNLAITLSVPSAEFSVTGSPLTNPTGTLAITANAQPPNTVWAGPASGMSNGVPSFRALTAADLTSALALSDGQVLVGSTGNDPVATTLTAGNNIYITNGPGSILIDGPLLEAGTGISITANGSYAYVFSNTGVTSVGLSLPVSLFSVSGSPVFSTGTLSATLTSQTANTIFAAPDGSSGTPSFRALALGDLPTLTDGQLYIGNTGFAPAASQLTAGSLIAIVPGTGTITVGTTALGMVSLSMPAGVFVVGTPTYGTNTESISVTFDTQLANRIFAGPSSGGVATPTFRAQVLADLPQLTNGQLYVGSTGLSVVAATLTGTSNQVTVTNGAGTITLATPQNIHTAATPTFASETLTATTNQLTLGTTNTATISATAPAASRTYTIADPGANANFVMDIAGNMVITNTPSVNQLLVATNTTAASWQSMVSGISGIVTSVGLALPVSVFTISGSPVISSGTLTGTFATQTANTIFAGPSSGAAAVPTFRSLVALDIPSLATSILTSGTLPIARGGTNSATALNNNRIMVSSGGAIVEAGAMANGTLLIGSSGAAPVVATLTAGTGISVTNTAGAISIANTGVTSVGLALPASVFTISGSPVITTGTLTGAFATQSANTIFAGPSSGAAATPTFRTQVLADLPRLTNGQLYVGSTGLAMVAATLTGTSNQITITNGAGSITLATPQNIHTAATPTFASETLTATTNQLTLGTTNTATISATAPAASRTYTIADPGANANFVMDTAGALTITNTPSPGQVLTYASSTTASWAAAPATSSIAYVDVNNDTSITGFSSATYANITTMTSTPAAGTYWVSFSSSVQPSTSSGIYNIGIALANVIVLHSVRQLTGSSSSAAVQTQAVVVATGSSAITAQWQKSSGSGTADMFGRSMILIRLA